MRFLRASPLIISIVLTILLSVVLNLILGAISLSENFDHATSHLAVAIPALLLAWSIAFSCPRRKHTRASRWGRRAAITGLVMISAGLVLESIGAFGYDGDDSRIEALTTLHSSAWLIEFPGVPVLLVGILLGMFSLLGRTPDRSVTIN
jgi:hypothetical protein